MRIIISFLISYLLCGETTAQQIHFNKRYDYSNGCDGALSIQPIDSGYVTIGKSNINCNIGKIAFTKVDLNGIVLFSKFYGDSGVDYFPGPASLIKTSDNEFAFCGSSSTLGIIHPMLMKLNILGDSLWIKKFDATANYNSVLYNCIQTSDHGYLLIGATDTTGDENVLLIRTDSLGSLIWQHNYGGTEIDEGWYVDCCRDGGFIIGAERANTSWQNIDDWVFKVDSNGVFQWQRIFGGPFQDLGTSVLVTSDNHIMVGCGLTSIVLPPNLYQSKPRIIELDSVGNTVFDKTYGSACYSCAVIKIIKDGNNYVAACQSVDTTGSTPIGNGFPQGLIIKINSLGDSLFYRTYKNLSGGQSHNYFMDINLANDSGYVACGFVVPVSPDTGTEDLWILKLDSTGCEYAGCNPTGILFISNEKPLFNIFPNPNNGTMQFDYNLEAGQIGQLIMYDLTGKIIQSWIIQPGQGTMPINEENLNNGIYFYRFISNGELINSDKIIIIK